MGSAALGGIAFNSGASNGLKYSLRPNMANKPVVFVTWYDAARFANWLHNGQGAGSTETGAYTLNGNTGLIVRNVGATVWLPTEDEWYKAAYYDPTPGAGGGDNYWLYATQSNSVPTVASANAFGDISNPGPNVANYNLGADWNSQDGNLTTVGSAGSESYYGTLDQSGNVGEWTDSAIEFGNQRVLRGGNLVFGEDALRSTSRHFTLPLNLESNIQGFRLASIPEPSSIILSLLASGALLTRRRRA
jgi:formylglycine-generating enzyme